jgi:hypothetical protein
MPSRPKPADFARGSKLLPSTLTVTTKSPARSLTQTATRVASACLATLVSAS